MPVVFIKTQNVIIILNIWNKINLSFRSCTCLFLIEKRMKFLGILTCGRKHDGKFNDINLRKFPTCKKLKSLSSNIGNKEESSANKIIMLTEKLFDNFLLIYMIIPMHKYVYKCAMVISNQISRWFSYRNDIHECICI